MVAVQIAGRGIRDKHVLDAMGRVPREEFVPRIKRHHAYQDSPLSIGSGQTISQPYMVAVMTEALGLSGGELVLEIGTGSGYQAAILAECGARVVTVERIESLLETAKDALGRIGCTDITYVAGDGTLGYEELAPYDGIIVTAGAPRVPEALKKQLAEGGRLVIPVGGRGFQECVVLEKKGAIYAEKHITGCTFVPLLGTDGW